MPNNTPMKKDFADLAPGDKINLRLAHEDETAEPTFVDVEVDGIPGGNPLRVGVKFPGNSYSEMISEVTYSAWTRHDTFKR